MSNQEFESRPEVNTALAELGGAIKCYRVSKSRLLMGLFAATIGIVFGCVFIRLGETNGFVGSGARHIRRTQEEKDVERRVLDGLGAALILGSFGVAWWVWRLRKTQIVRCPEGLVRVVGDRVESFPWRDVEAVDVCTVRNRAFKGAIGALVKVTANSYTILRRNGRTLHFNRDKIGNSEELFESLQQESEARGIPVTRHQVG